MERERKRNVIREKGLFEGQTRDREERWPREQVRNNRVGTKTRRKFKERALIKRSFVDACHKAHSRRRCVYLQTPGWKEQYGRNVLTPPKSSPNEKSGSTIPTVPLFFSRQTIQKWY